MLLLNFQKKYNYYLLRSFLLGFSDYFLGKTKKMALFCGRLVNRSLLATIARMPNMGSSVRLVQVTHKPFEQPMEEPYDDKNARLNRPMSPHLTIYAPQVTSMLSITHRITGMMLSGYFSVLGIGALVLPHDVSHYITMIEGLHLSPVTLLLLKFTIALPLAYHSVNGLRHLYWDTGRGLSLKEVYSTGYTMLAVATVFSLILLAL